MDAVFLRPITLSQPVRLAEPFAWVPHIPFAFWIVDALRPSSIVELGTRAGNSYSAFTQAVATLHLPAACYAVDTWQGDEHAGFYGEEVFAEWQPFHDRHFGAFSTLIRQTFDAAAESFGAGSIDLLHIDGLPTYDAVGHDFETWLPKLSARAVVLLHETNVRQDDFGVWRFWEDLQARYPTFTFVHGFGLGVAGVGADLPSDVRSLLTEVKDSPERVALTRQLFASLGEGIERRGVLARLEKQGAVLGAARTVGAAHVQVVAERNRRHEVLVGHDATLETSPRQIHTDAAAEREQMAVHHQHIAVRDERIKRLEAELALEAAQVTLQRHEVTRLQELVRAVREAEALARHRERLTAGKRVAEQAAARASEARTIADRDRMTDTQRRLLLAARSLQVLSHQLRTVRQSLATTALALSHVRGSRAWRWTASVRSNIGRLRGEGARSDSSAASGDDNLAELVRHPDPLPETVQRDAALIAESGVLDEVYYLSRHPEAVLGGLAPVEHYLTTGTSAGYSPSPLFDAEYYRARNPDVTEAGTDPLVHFLRHGAAEGRDPNPLFSVQYYLRANPDVAQHGLNPLVHYLRWGVAAGQSPHPLFDARSYLDAYPDVAAEGIDPLVHFIERGARERRRPHALFDIDFYLARYPDVASALVNPLVHYLAFGWREGRDPSPDFSTSAYLAGHPELVDGDECPLVHYLRESDGRPPHHHRATSHQPVQPPEFTAHNIRLADGTLTKPDMGRDMSQYPWFLAARRVLDLAFPADRASLRLVDLGCLEGGYAVEFARMGFDVLGIEIRDSNFACCQYVHDRAGLDNVHFVRDDALNVASHGQFDVVYCCGLLYHLEHPRAYLQTLSSVCTKLLILNTHFASNEDRTAFNLSPLTTHEGLRGRWYPEHGETDPALIDRLRWSAFSNHRSFWILRGDLITALKEAGFTTVWEQYDALEDPHASLDNNSRPDHRGIFVGLKD